MGNGTVIASTEIDPRWGKPSPLHDPYVLAHFKTRASDVLITTAPKAGTTWMQQILHQLRSGGDDSFRSIDDVVPWLERPRAGIGWQQRLEYYESLPDPRIFKTHCTAPQTPGIGIARIVLTSRDPRDCCISFYHHLRNLTDAARAESGHRVPENLDEHIDRWLAFGAWYRNVQSWWPYRDHPRVLWLRYEDLKQDLGTGVDRIAGFLDWPMTPATRAKVLEYSSFAWMKAHDAKFSGQGDFKPGKFIRKGDVGGHREALTPLQSKRILDKARELLEPECLEFLEIGPG